MLNQTPFDAIKPHLAMSEVSVAQRFVISECLVACIHAYVWSTQLTAGVACQMSTYTFSFPNNESGLTTYMVPALDMMNHAAMDAANAEVQMLGMQDIVLSHPSSSR
jgi:hypothetical protein